MRQDDGCSECLRASVSPGVVRAKPQRLYWCTSGATLASAVGFVLALIDQAVAPIIDRQRTFSAVAPSWWQQLVAVVVVASGYALITLAVSLFVLAWRVKRRVVASALVGSVIALLFAFHAIGLTMRALSGSFLTVGTVEFVLASGKQLLVTLFSDFLGTIVGLGLGTVSMGVIASWYLLRRRWHISNASHRLRVLLSAVVIVPALLYGSATVAAPATTFIAGISQTTPELAFLASLESLHNGWQLFAKPSAIEQRTRSFALEAVGPPQSAGEDWKNNLHAAADGPQPNVLLLMLESLPASHVGYLGYARSATSRIDALAARSVRMRRVWATATHSNYAQMAILSSLFPRRGHGLDVYRRLDYPRVLRHDVFYLLGYATATISSQDEDWQGMRRFQMTGSPTTFWHSDDYQGPHVLTSSDKAVPDAITVDKFIDWVESQAGRRWSAYVNLQSTHFPYSLPRGAREPFQPTGPIRGPFHYLAYQQRDRAVIVNRYDNALRYVDEQVGRIEHYLEQSGQLQNTLWVVTADHGELFGEWGHVTHGRTLREGELRVPLLLHWPLQLLPGDVDEPVSHLDVLPTVLELIGVAPHPSFQGTSFARLSHHIQANNGIFFNIQGQRLAEGVLCWPWKLVVASASHKTSLFHLGLDPDERADVASKERYVVASLSAVLRHHVDAQINFHQKHNTDKKHFYAPRLPRCPELPDRPTENQSTLAVAEFWRHESR